MIAIKSAIAMSWFSPKLPIREEDRQWVNNGFGRLEQLLGRRRMLGAKIVEPTAEDFPDPYDRTQESVDALFRRVCHYMQVDRSTVTLEIFPDEGHALREVLPSWHSAGGRQAAGMYVHEQDDGISSHISGMVVAIRSSMLIDPMSLVATMAHELGHVILLGGKLLTHNTTDHESMTDLLTVFLGLGIFTANAAGQFKQFQDERRAGWSTQRLGYLPQPVFGYALAKWALERGENKPDWAQHLTTNVRSDFRRSLRWLLQNPNYVPLADPIA